MLDPAERQRIALNLWTARIIPLILAGIVGYATYVLVALLAVNYLLVKHHDEGAAIPILVIYFVLFLLMATSFFRLVYITVLDPPYVPLGPGAIKQLNVAKKRKPVTKSEEEGIGGGEYDTEAAASKYDPDSPGLELFYTKDVFVAEMDGKPRWCNHCLNWKPDRAHHCSSSGRCISKMDHFCPWVGGPVGETNLKFFIQFTSYTALYSLDLVVIMAVYIRQQLHTEGESYNRNFAAVLGLAGFFFMFTFGMASTALFLAASNLTQIENLGAKTKVHTLAVLKPPQELLNRVAPVIAAQLSYPEITYPLGTGIVFPRDEVHPSNVGVLPEVKINSHIRHAETVDVSQAMSMIQNQPPLPFQGPVPTETEHGEPSGPLPSAGERNPETSSQRDLRATRTFAILKMERGDNPWDLGSDVANLKSVMGNGFADWLLPIRRSPSCNHEGTESQFAIGPWVDRLRCSFGFIPPEEMRPIKEKKEPKKRSKKPPQEQDSQAQGGPNPPADINGSIGMQTLNGNAVTTNTG